MGPVYQTGAAATSVSRRRFDPNRFDLRYFYQPASPAGVGGINHRPMTLLISWALSATVFAQTPDWRVLRDHTPSARLIDLLSDFARREPANYPEARFEFKRRLYLGLAALDARPDRTERRYLARLPVEQRERLAELAPQLLAHLTRNEPYLRIAVRAARRREWPTLPPRTWRERARDAYAVMITKVTGRKLFVKTPARAAQVAPAVVRLERMLRENARPARVRPMQPYEELIEVLEDLADPEGQALATPDAPVENADRLGRYILAKVHAVEDPAMFARVYRALFETDQRANVARAWPWLKALVERVESPAVVASQRRFARRKSATSPEADLLRGLRDLGLSRVSQAFARIGRTSLANRFAEMSEVDRRALHWTRLEQIIAGGDAGSSSVRVGCERALDAFSKRETSPGDDGRF